MPRAHCCGPHLRDGPNLRDAASRPPARQPSVGQKTGIANLSGDAQNPSMPITVTSEIHSPNPSEKKEATSLEVGYVGPAASPSD